MADQPRCDKCGGDRIATTLKQGQALCNECAGLPSIAARFPVLGREDVEQARNLRPIDV